MNRVGATQVPGIRLMRWVGVLAILAGLAIPDAGAETPEQVLAGARRTLAGVVDLRARFEQTSHLAASGLDTTAAGVVELSRGGLMRWVYRGDDPQEIISDGETLWFYQVRDRTVMRRTLAGLPAASRLALDLLGGFVGIEEQFELGSCGARCLELTPREPQPDLSRLQVELGDAGLVKAITSEDALGNRTRVEFSDVELDPGLKAERFRFTPPQDVQVLDMESPR